MNENKPPITYRVQHGCHNCENCLVHWEQDDPISYLCMLDQPLAPQPPPNYDRWDLKRDSENYKHTMAVWDWRNSLSEVAAAGICDFHEIRK